MFYLMVVYSKKNTNITLLKKRYHLNVKTPKLRFGDSGLVLKQNIRFEFIYYFYVRKFLKKFFKKKKLYKKYTKAWLFLRPNHVLTKKSKNARMGKGKGGFIRWCSLLHKGYIFMEFKNISLTRLHCYKKKLEKKIRIPIQLIFNKNYNSKALRKQYIGSNKTLIATPFWRIS